MKIYLKNISIPKIQKQHVDKYFIKNYKKNYIYTEEGIFNIDNNNLFKMKIKDRPLEKSVLAGFDIYIDKSIMTKNEEYYHLPIHNYPEELTEEIYKLNAQSSLQMNIEMKENFIHNLYFVSKCSIDTIGVKKDIITFLSLLKIKNDM